jgi:hypothetical protein
MKKLKHLDLFENFEVAAHERRTEKEILNEQNLQDLCSKLNYLANRSTDSELNYQAKETIILIQAWAEEKLGIMVGDTSGNLYQDRIRTTTTEVLEDVEVKLRELLRFCSAGVYSDRTVQENIEEFLQML